MGWQTLKHGARQGGFTGTHLSGEQNKTTFSIQSIL